MAAKLFAVTLLALVAVAAAQIQVCDNKLKVSSLVAGRKGGTGSEQQR